MRKIPTVYVRDEQDRAHVTNQPNPVCSWVFRGEGTPTRKYNGTCTMLDTSGRWWARREVRLGKAVPPCYLPIATDPITGKTVGWEPIEQSGFVKAFRAVDKVPTVPGTYELCGPKVNGNPEKLARHMLISHADAEVLTLNKTVPCLTAPERIVRAVAAWGWEGIVWHHMNGQMAKLKVRDLRPEIFERT
jgi:hypothetical protein